MSADAKLPPLLDRPVTLVGRTNDSLGLEDAVRAGAVADGAVGMVWSASAFSFVVLREGELHGRHGRLDDIGAFFEARIFDGTTELRWLHQSSGRGRAVAIAETSLPSALDSWQELPSRKAEATIGPVPYLLWGKPQGAPDGIWSESAENRIGALHVPHVASANQRIRLVAKEYLARFADEHPPAAGVRLSGNAMVIEERLIRLEAVSSMEETA